MLERLKTLARMIAPIHAQSRSAASCARGAAGACVRTLRPNLPQTWEFGGFSQHGEDGIIDYLCCQIVNPTRTFFEIGASDGSENCTSWLAIVRDYEGVMVEGDPVAAQRCQRFLDILGRHGVRGIQCFVTLENIDTLLLLARHKEPDVFSLDVDGVDYHLMNRVFELGYRPRICAVEYNSAMGPANPVSVPYKPDFRRFREHPSGLYYGCGVAAWKALFDRYGYSFVTVEQAGTNAFFINPAAFPEGFPESLHGVPFRVNTGDHNAATNLRVGDNGVMYSPNPTWQDEWEFIKHMPFVTAA